MQTSGFVNYAHRGASEYAPENTMMSFCLGIYMGANGIETDVQLTKDGVAVLFHDDTLMRMTGIEGAVSDYTYDELRGFWVKKGALADKILKLEDFLQNFGFYEITFAIELKQRGTAKPAADLVRKYGVGDKVVMTSFILDELQALRAYAPELRTGYLTSVVDDDLLEKLRMLGIGELCPKGELVTAGLVEKWHRLGFNVRAWGIFNEDIMRHVYDAGADGMTVNFPDKLQSYIRQKD